MCPKQYQQPHPTHEPGRTPGSAEGTEQDVERALRSKGMQPGNRDQRVGTAGQSPGGEEPNRTPGSAEG